MKRLLLASLLTISAIICLPHLAFGVETDVFTFPFAPQQLDSKSSTGTSNKVSSENRKEAERLYKTGVQLGLKGNYSEAIEKFQQSIAVNPLDADTYFSLGHAYLDTERWSEGIEALRESLRLQPKDAEAYQLIGFAQSKLGDYKQAVESFRQAVLLKPDWAEARYNLGNAFYKLGQFSAAVGYYTEVTAFKGNEADPFNDLGAAYAQMGNHDNEAFQAFKRAIHLKSNHAPAHNNIGLIHYRQGNYIEAADAFKRALAIRPGDPVIRRNLDFAIAKLARDSSGAVIETVAPKTANSSGPRAIESNQWLARTVLDPAPGVVVPPSTVASTNTPSNTSLNTAAPKEARSSAPSTSTQTPALQKTPQPVKETPKAGESAKNSKEVETTSVKPSAPEKANGAAANNTVAKTDAKKETKAESKANKTSNKPAVSAPVDSYSASTNGSSTARTTPLTTSPSPTTTTTTTTTSGPAASAATTATSAVATAVPPTSIYRIGAGDMLDIRLLNMPTNDSTLFTVLAGGFLEYPLLEAPLMVSGLTTDEIDARLTAELERRNVVKDPEVVVSVREYASHVVIVSGLVNDPGNKVLRREAIPLYVVLADAQPKPEAGRVEITSHQSGQRTVVDIADQSASNTLIYAGDVLNVVTQPQLFYYIGGNVSEPGQKDFHAGLTLTQAILAAGGSLQEGAGSSKNWTKSVLTAGVVPPTSKTELRVTRQSADGRLNTLRYNLREIMTGKIPDPVLQAGDRIEVGK